MKEITKIYIFKDVRYTKEEFNEKFGYTPDEGEMILNMLIDKASVTVVSQAGSARDYIDQQQVEQEVVNHGNRVEEDSRAAAKDSEDLIKEVQIPYSTMHEAELAGAKITVRYGLDVATMQRNNKAYLILYDVSEKTLIAIEREYNVNRTVQAGVDKVNQGITAVGDVLSYTLNDIGLPVMKSGMKLAAGIAKSASRFASKTAASGLNIAAQTQRETDYLLANDPDVIMAKRELINAKDAIKRRFGSKKTTGSNFEIKR